MIARLLMLAWAQFGEWVVVELGGVTRDDMLDQLCWVMQDEFRIQTRIQEVEERLDRLERG